MNIPFINRPFLGFGAGLRPVHYSDILTNLPKVGFFEIISENFMIDGGKPLATLDKIRSHYPIVMHGVSMSLGSADPLNFDYLKKLKTLASRIEPAWISDHLCWTGINGKNAHDLLPMPYNEESLAHMIDRIKKVQDFLGERIAIENPSSYVSFATSTMSEWEFICRMATAADCLLLLDVNNVFVSAFNHDFSAKAYIDALPKERIIQIHLAGHTDKETHLLDTHDHPVSEAVWDLYAYTLRNKGKISSMIEWDDHIPPFSELEIIISKMKTIACEVCPAT